MKPSIKQFAAVAACVLVVAVSLAIGICRKSPVSQTSISETFSTSSPTYTTELFACAGGEDLNYWFENLGENPCTVWLYREHAVGFEEVSQPITVDPRDTGHVTVPNAEDGVFKIRVVCPEGIGSGIRGSIRAQ